MNPPGESLTQLILTETENDRVKWVTALQHLHKLLKDKKEISKQVSSSSQLSHSTNIWILGEYFN